MKKASPVFDPISIASIRIIFAATTLAVIWMWRRPRGRVRFGPLLIVFVLLGFVWPFSIQPYLIERNGSGFIGMLVSLVPLPTVLFSVPLLGTYPTRRQLVGVCGGLVFLIILWKDGIDRHISPLDLLLAVTVPVGYAVANIIVKKHFSKIPPLTLAVVCQSLAGIMVIPVGVFAGEIKQEPTGSMVQALVCIAFLGIVGTGLCQFLFVWLIQLKGPLYAGMATYLIPLGAVMWGWVGHEKTTSVQLVALIGVIAMVVLVQTPVRADGLIERVAPEPQDT